MPKSTPASVEQDLMSSLHTFKDRALAVKDAHQSARQEIRNDPMKSDMAKRDHLGDLDKQTRSTLDGIKVEQESYVRRLHDRLEQELRGDQPADANSVMLRRDAADRARHITEEDEALAVLSDAVHGGDDTLAHAMGYRARQSGWVDVLDAYKVSQPQSADAASALAVVEGLSSDAGFNLANSITYSSPIA